MRLELVLSICGDSRVGKGTLIDKINYDEKGIRERFGIRGLPEFYATRKVTRSGKTVYRSTEEMYENPSGCIVYRWQYKGDDEIARLLSFYPDVRHHIVLLWRPWNQHQCDRDQHPTSRHSARAAWKKMILPRFRKNGRLAKLGITIELVDASKDLYTVMDWPEI